MAIREVENEIRELIVARGHDVGSMRNHRRGFSQRLASEDRDEVLALALRLVSSREHWSRFLAYELVKHHKPTLTSLKIDEVEAMGEGISDWAAVDTFGLYVAGQAWRLGGISDSDVLRWAASPDVWWRRTALVSTVALNIKSQGGTGDVPRTMMVCEALANDREDMAVKALSWALRELVKVDPAPVREFLDSHQVAARVRREVNNKLRTGKKNPRAYQSGPADGA